MNEPTSEPLTQELLRKAAILRMFAEGFAYPETGHRERMLQACARIEATLDGNDTAVRDLLHAVSSAWRNADPARLAPEYFRLFLGNGPVSLHETAYGDGRRIAGRAVELADINGFYHAFGFEVSAQEPDLPDHVGTETEFYSLLLVKQAYAQASGWSEKCEITHSAARTFLEQHLGRWVDALAASLREHNGASPYRGHTEALETWLKRECGHLGVQPILLERRLPDDAIQAETFVCPQANH